MSAMVVIPVSLAVQATLAAPVTVVPWNGYSGAASFTFDDACQSQLDNLVPALRTRKLHATFFLYDVGGAFSNNKAAWVAAAKDGNELANHTVDHEDLSTSTNATFEVSEMASRLRNADPSIQAVTLAYPGCAVGNEAAVNAENIIGRSCMFAGPYQPLQWNNPPSDWNNVGAIYVSDDNTATGPTIDALDAAKNGGWISTLDHGVGGDWLAVTTANVLAMIDRAVNDGLWVGTYQEVAAYWRAGLSMAQANTVKTDSGWNVSWTSPHPKMPTSVPLRIRLDAGTFGNDISVYQKGDVVAAQADGSYLIQFMDLGMLVRNVPVITVPAHRDTVFDGGFDLGTLGWTFNVWEGGAHGSVINGEYKIQIDSVGQHNSGIQLVQNGIILRQGRSYEVKFDAYASANRTLEANVEQDVSPWASYLPALQNFNLSTTKTTYSYAFTMTNPTDSNGRISFNAGASTETVYLDNISIKVIPTGIRASTGSLAKGLRWSAGVLLVPGTESGRLQIINARGQNRIVDVAGGRASTGLLPVGLYQARLLDGTSDASLNFVVMP
jgi:peptidoglycan/xylan/chitin deacetylase (PgdA/CDA1 family)